MKAANGQVASGVVHDEDGSHFFFSQFRESRTGACITNTKIMKNLSFLIFILQLTISVSRKMLFVKMFEANQDKQWLNQMTKWQIFFIKF